MFITGNKEDGFKVHFNKVDMLDFVVAGENVMVELSAEKAKELEDRLEEVVNPTPPLPGD